MASTPRVLIFLYSFQSLKILAQQRSGHQGGYIYLRRAVQYSYCVEVGFIRLERDVVSTSQTCRNRIYSAPQVRLVELVHDEVDSGTNMPCRLLQLQFSLNLMQI